MSIRDKTNCFLGLYSFCFYKCLANRAFKIVQYGCQGKNCLFSDHSERTLCEIYSSRAPEFGRKELKVMQQQQVDPDEASFSRSSYKNVSGGATCHRKKGQPYFMHILRTYRSSSNCKLLEFEVT